jgi:hypothetical protein
MLHLEKPILCLVYAQNTPYFTVLTLRLNDFKCQNKPTIPTDRPPFVGKVSANFCG